MIWLILIPLGLIAAFFALMVWLEYLSIKMGDQCPFITR